MLRITIQNELSKDKMYYFDGATGHYNTGPGGMPKWWSSDAEDGAYLW
jgi:hypothetical protein